RAVAVRFDEQDGELLETAPGAGCRSPRELARAPRWMHRGPAQDQREIARGVSWSFPFGRYDGFRTEPRRVALMHWSPAGASGIVFLASERVRKMFEGALQLPMPERAELAAGLI